MLKAAEKPVTEPEFRAGQTQRDIRAEFPVLERIVRGKPILYLDNAATTQKPQAVVDTITRFYQEENSNIHRGLYYMSEEATDRYEATRDKVRDFLNARDRSEIVFLRGATEALNLIAQSYGTANLSEGDVVLVSEMEHHSNIVPWQMVCEKTGARVVKIPITDSGEIDGDAFTALLELGPKIVAITHQSNALGTINPIVEIVEESHAAGAVVVVDGAQAAAHLTIDVQELGCDFYVFSAHKIFGPTGAGVLYGRSEILSEMPPYHGGGEMIRSVSFEGSSYKTIPYRFEAGTPPIASVIGLGAALDYLRGLNWDAVQKYEADLLDYGTKSLTSIDGLRIYGTSPMKASILSFTIDGVHPHDLGTILDSDGVCIRAGHHCAQPVMERFRIPATARASLALYNVREEIDGLATSLEKAIEMFRG